MSTSVSVVIPVKDGARHLERLLAAVRRQGEGVELLAIDSGSRDGSVELARAGGATVHEIAPEEFGHGRTRNLAMELATGDVVCFLTQDAVPEPGWLAAHLAAYELDPEVGAVYGPHLPWPDTSPMIARELDEFFASMSPDGKPTLQRAGDLAFLSNVNASYARRCWEEIRFEDLAYAEDQAFGRAMLDAGWVKVFHPGAAVRHAHDYGPLEFARRYFDEYRGLRETAGHVEPLKPGRVLADVRGGVAADRRWMAERDWPQSRRAVWTARSLLHHGSRKAAAAAATRPGRLPAGVERRLSLEGRASVARANRRGDGPPDRATADARSRAPVAPVPARYADVLRYAKEGAVPLAPRNSTAHERARLHLAFVVPPFRRGSGGHSTIFGLIARLERMGHTCTVWIVDPGGNGHIDRPAVTRRDIVEWFTPISAPVFAGFDAWHGADVAVATGWDTAHPVAMLPGCGARAYLVQDHEPEFFATSAERIWAEQTYDLGLYPICASRWLRDLLAEQHGCEGAYFHLGVDHDVYRPQDHVERRRDTIIFYARAATARRAVPLGLLALEELCARRPDTRVIAFGQERPLKTSFQTISLGVAAPARLAAAYAEATAGLCLSLTNYSLIPQEMLACGLPCVDLAGGSSQTVFGADGPVVLADADPIALADALEALLDDERHWRAKSSAGIEFVADASWDTAAKQVEAGLREALRRAAMPDGAASAGRHSQAR
ncbi:MAG TPA: glycosyltransferase [Thermoleophilaceae bacterium]|nr:glycosyltransferase [Thermoleophilaceae bacterium]